MIGLGQFIPNLILSFDYRLQLAYMKLELLVIIGQSYGGEFVPRSCTHRPSHYESWACKKKNKVHEPLIG